MRSRSLVVVIAAATTLVGAPAAHAKITCRGDHPPRELRADGLPRSVEVKREYRVKVAVPKAPAANPRPIAMFVRCEGPGAAPAGDSTMTQELRGRRPATMRIQFPKRGWWRAAVMDRGGRFHSLGTIHVVR